MTAERQYVAALIQKAHRDSGGPTRLGTTVVPEAERAGTRSATSYPLPGRTLIWSDPALADALSDLNSPRTITTTEFITAAGALGGELLGIGNQRVLDGPLIRPAADDAGLSVTGLDRDHEADRRLLAAFIDACGPDDVDEAELDLAELDPDILVLLAADGSIVSYASARPYDDDASFDDIGVVTRPDHRGRRLGGLAVFEFIRRRQARDIGRRFIYRCNAENEGSNRVAESLGFTLVHQIGAMRFPSEVCA